MDKVSQNLSAQQKFWTSSGQFCLLYLSYTSLMTNQEHSNMQYSSVLLRSCWTIKLDGPSLRIDLSYITRALSHHSTSEASIAYHAAYESVKRETSRTSVALHTRRQLQPTFSRKPASSTPVMQSPTISPKMFTTFKEIRRHMFSAVRCSAMGFNPVIMHVTW